MSKPRTSLKVANDMFFVQGSWALGFLGILLLIQIVKMALSFFTGSELNSYYISTFIAGNIFTLVIGIISPIGFIPHFVSHGVTRKDYFKGGLIGTMGVALALPIISAIVSGVLKIFEKLLNLSLTMVPLGEKMIDEEGDFVGNLIQSIIFTPYVDLNENWLLAIFVFALNLFTYYVAGWLIGSAFCRFNVIGILSIPVAFILTFTEDLLLSLSLGLPVPSFAAGREISFMIALIGVFMSIAIISVLIRQLTKKIIVKA